MLAQADMPFSTPGTMQVQRLQSAGLLEKLARARIAGAHANLMSQLLLSNQFWHMAVISAFGKEVA